MAHAEQDAYNRQEFSPTPDPAPHVSAEAVKAVVAALHRIPDDDTMEDSARRIIGALIESGELVPANELREARKWMAALRDLDGHTIQEAAQFFRDAPPDCPPEVLALGSAWVDKMLRGQQMLSASWDRLEAERDELHAERDRLKAEAADLDRANEGLGSALSALLEAVRRHEDARVDEAIRIGDQPDPADRDLYAAAERVKRGET